MMKIIRQFILNLTSHDLFSFVITINTDIKIIFISLSQINIQNSNYIVIKIYLTISLTLLQSLLTLFILDIYLLCIILNFFY